MKTRRSTTWRASCPRTPARWTSQKPGIQREGTDVSIFTYGASLPKSLDAAEALAKEGINAEVIDLRVLRPLDDATIMTSVAKTHRALIVDEGWRSGGISAEISARIMEQAFYELDSPCSASAARRCRMPYAHHLEQAALPQVGNHHCDGHTTSFDHHG